MNTPIRRVLSGSLITFQQPCEAALLSLLHTWSSRPGFKLALLFQPQWIVCIFSPCFPSFPFQADGQTICFFISGNIYDRQGRQYTWNQNFLPPFLPSVVPSSLPSFFSFLLVKPRSSKEMILCIPKFWDSWGGSKRRNQEVFLGLGREDVSSSSSWMAVLWG